MNVEVVRQYPGVQQVARKVKVNERPGQVLHVSAAIGTQNQSYEATAVQYAERHDFDRHRSWGAAHRGPGIRFICESGAIDDPDHKGFWTTLGVWK